MAKENPTPTMPLTPEAQIITALHAVMQEAAYVQKTGENDFHGYSYATEADVLERIRPAMIKHGLVLIPSINQVSSIDQYGNTSVIVHYTLAHTSGAVWPHPIVAAGCGNDRAKSGATGDKGLYKALTGANKYLLFKLFQIETGDDPEQSQADKAREEYMKNAAQFYLEGGRIAISKAETVAELKEWWASETGNREAAGVIKGTDQYADLYAAFLARGKELSAKEKNNGIA
jgi:hypothetical protein